MITRNHQEDEILKYTIFLKILASPVALVIIAYMLLRQAGENEDLILVALEAEDLLLAGSIMKNTAWMKWDLTGKLELRELKESKDCLDLELERHMLERRLCPTQTNYESLNQLR